MYYNILHIIDNIIYIIDVVAKSLNILKDYQKSSIFPGGCQDYSVGKSTGCSLIGPLSIWWLTTVFNSSSKRSNTLTFLFKVTDIHTVHRHTCTQAKYPYTRK